MNNGNMPANPQNGAFSCADDFNSSEAMGGVGLTKREAFAMAAMQNILTQFNPYEQGSFDSSDYDLTAEHAFGLADAMLRRGDMK